MSDWDPPVPVDLDLIRPRDEEYWDRYEATPKGFVAAETGRRLWSNRFGSTTSVRLPAMPGEPLERTAQRLRESLLATLSPESFGLSFRPVKQEGLSAAAGATDFAFLFIAFSFFLIISSALLIALLFRLSVEQRAREIGLLLAAGYRLRTVRLRLVGEGLVLASIGAVLGAAGGVGYAGLLIAGLRTLWLSAVGSTRLELHVPPASLVLGAAITVTVILLSTTRTVLRLGRVPCPALLAGSFETPVRSGRGRIAPLLALGGALTGLGLLAAAWLSRTADSPSLAFGIGTALLVAGLARFSIWCRGARGRRAAREPAGLLAMAARNTWWNPGRSLLSVALVASACFVIVMVGANRVRYGEELRARDSGTGGFALVAESDIPLYQQLGHEADRFDLGFSDEDSVALEPVEFYEFRVLPGDDASCLNLYRPERPRVLGVPPEMVRRGGFRFQKRVELPPGEDDPWKLLELDLGPGVVPAVADANSAQWILHLGLGGELELEDDLGRSLRLRLVGLVEKSILQSEVLISEAAFLEHFPAHSGYAYFLIDAPFEEAAEIATVLERNLGRFGFDSTTTRDKLAAFQAVEHTYLSTFQALGGLGLLLGTVGLGIVLARNVIERRGELATLRAFGFGRARLVRLVLAENAFLLLGGILIGSGSAIIAVLPRLSAVHVPWLSLLGTLAGVLLVGMLAGAVAASVVLRVPLLPALKSEA